MDRDRAENTQKYYESLCGYQKSLLPQPNSFTIRSSEWLGHYGMEYSIFDNRGNHVLSSMDKSIILEFKEWLEMEVNQQ
jgi:hypothetical protein